MNSAQQSQLQCTCCKSLDFSTTGAMMYAFSTRPVDKVSGVSNEEFEQTFFRKKKPVVFSDIVNKWLAYTTWSLDFFRNLDFDLPVHIEDGDVLQGETQFHKETLNDYVASLLALELNNEQVSYLSAFDILRFLPELAKDVDFSLLTHMTVKNVLFAWLGPPQTVTGFHTDWVHNLLAQIHGRKEILLVAPHQSKLMYRSRKYDFRSQLSEIVIDEKTLDNFPDFRNVDVFRVVLLPGEMLFIPKGWWHYVKSLDISISVNNFGLSRWDLYTVDFWEKIKMALHKRSLYRSKNCTCHMQTSLGIVHR